MAYPIKTYANIFDITYSASRARDGMVPKGLFGHLIIRDSNTVGKDYLLVGCNHNASSALDASIRLNKKQVKQVIRACEKFLKRIGETK